MPHTAPFDRCAVFSGLFLVAYLNGVAGHAVESMQAQGWATAAFDLFGVSAVLWTALVAGMSILRGGGGDDRFSRRDGWVALVVVGAAVLPFATASMAALCALSCWAIFTSGTGSPLRRAGIVFLAVTGALLWGRVFLALFSRPLLNVDAIFVAGLIGSEHRGNMLWYAGEPTRLVVAPGCSSMQGLSLALVLWVTINQFFEVRFGWKPALWCLAALAATIAINVLRIASMLRFPAHLEELHHGWGYHLSMWLTLAAVAAICLWGARREVFRPA